MRRPKIGRGDGAALGPSGMPCGAWPKWLTTALLRVVMDGGIRRSREVVASLPPRSLAEAAIGSGARCARLIMIAGQGKSRLCDTGANLGRLHRDSRPQAACPSPRVPIGGKGVRGKAHGRSTLKEVSAGAPRHRACKLASQPLHADGPPVATDPSRQLCRNS